MAGFGVSSLLKNERDARITIIVATVKTVQYGGWIELNLYPIGRKEPPRIEEG
jgi:hypothetical protein